MNQNVHIKKKNGSQIYKKMFRSLKIIQNQDRNTLKKLFIYQIGKVSKV